MAEPSIEMALLEATYGPEKAAQILAEREAMTPEQKAARKAENDRRKKELLEYCKQKGQRRQKLREALLEEEKNTGLQVPFRLWLRFGIASVMPEEGEEMPDTSEQPNEPPEITYYRRFEENFMPEVRELKLP